MIIYTHAHTHTHTDEGKNYLGMYGHTDRVSRANWFTCYYYLVEKKSFKKKIKISKPTPCADHIYYTR